MFSSDIDVICNLYCCLADFVSVLTNSIWTVEMHLIYTRSCIHNNSSLCVRSKTFCCCVSDNQACATPHLWRTAAHITDITCVTGWVNWMQKWNGSISTSDRSDFYRTNVFILKHSHCSKQLTSLCLNSKSQICQNWKWIHFILHSIDSAREASENTFAVRQLEFSANITIVNHSTTLPVISVSFFLWVSR